ncbi:PorT family protein [Flavobacterium franklandianum]|uniref:PorT family protein n=3 Tax=Flavobacterium TaxID=237 RepID=A0A432C7K7_9FLAO|nr:porin family protein [Flavobacterium franklandianum]RTY95723.1 PorT family protein [Flavobacterium bomense]TRX21245.1 PorT family protein [Flavobacterium franklandianum]TRX30105.1 PorT family protein [Flavobacterium franklandianum]
MRLFISSFLLLYIIPVFSQEKATAEEVPKIKIDSLYREDQFYFSFTLNTLQNKPMGLTQDKFSSGFSVGFLRDFPVNKNRTVAIAPGVGLSYNNYNQNLKITELNQIPVYSIIESNATYNKNRFSQLLVEMPIEFRWRSSTFESHKFWRIYGGFKVGYLIYDKSIYEDSIGQMEVHNNNDFNKFQYGTYISVGYNSINIFAYYGLNSLFESAKTTTETIDMNSFNVGIMFYIL